MKHFANKLCKVLKYIALPIWKNIEFFVMFSILLSLPFWINCVASVAGISTGAFRTMSFQPIGFELVPWSVLCAYVWCGIFQFLYKCPKFVKFLKYIIIGLLVVLLMIELFLAFHFRLSISPLSLLTLFQSNPTESLEFATIYIFRISTFSMTAALLLCCAAVVYGVYRARKHIQRLVTLFQNNCVANICIFLSLILIVVDSSDKLKAAALGVVTDRGHEMQILVDAAPQDVFSKTVFSLKNLLISSNDIDYIIRNIDNINIDKCSFASPKIVLILGESHSKYHSGLYGYPLPTNPALMQRENNGELYVFEDVVSPFNTTVSATQYLFSTADASPESDWSRSPLFPTVFKKAGYKVFWFDNQMINTNSEKDVYNTLAYNYLNNSIIEKASFDVRNTQRYEYDSDLLSEWIENKRFASDADLVVFHLMGQHFDYKERFPKTPEYLYFTSDSVNRPDLEKECRQRIADYDNATRYNDNVVNAIISEFEQDDAVVIYLSDHGEEVFDYRDDFGRSFEYPYTSNQVKYQFGIPMFIWCSDKHRVNHPEIIENVKSAVSKPFSSSDISHLLFDLAGIQADCYDPTRSPINPQFTPRHRHIAQKAVYETVMGE